MKNRSLLIILFLILLPLSAWFAAQILLNIYVNSGARQLLKLEKEGLLSREYGYVWQEINSNKKMRKVSGSITGDTIDQYKKNLSEKAIRDFPSLAAISELNEIENLYKTITVADRHGIPLTRLQTTHTCVDIADINEILTGSLLATEDKNFYSRKSAWEFGSLIRASFKALFHSIKTLKPHKPRGSSTIHMQVARFLLMKCDSRGYAYSEQSIRRKFQELKLAQALKIAYSNNEILTTYINHCVSAGKNMRGYHDISMKLFGVDPGELNLEQSLYLARLVKWNRHIPSKIIHQIKTSMPSLGRDFGWTRQKQDSILRCLDTMSFRSTKNIIPRHSHLIDLANEYWKEICRGNGIKDAELADMDIADPESIIRRYGNLTITLTIDYRLQSLLEHLVNTRGFGPDTTIRTDIRIASENTFFPLSTDIPQDTLRKHIVLSGDSVVNISGVSLRLHTNDTLVQTIRYKKLKEGIRRSCVTGYRDTATVRGQYFAYAIMNSRSRELLAYYSRDRLGSRLQSLHNNRNPNGSSTSKPLIYALAWDLGVYSPSDMASDDVEIGDSSIWTRYIYDPSGKGGPGAIKRNVKVGTAGMTYRHPDLKSGYTVHNHHKSFDGYDYLFNHLSNSNNIMAVETMFRLNTDMTINSVQAEKMRAFLSRCGLDAICSGNRVTGPSLYTALAGLCIDSAITDSVKNPYCHRYSTALGTLELSLYEQLHLFNILYDGKLIVKPAKHPRLFIRKIELSGSEVLFDDPVPSRTIFDDISKINPVHLGLHKRLLSASSPLFFCHDISSREKQDVFFSNFAKSGTTDDIIKPYYAESHDKSRTGYGLWNAVLRLNLKREDLLSAIDSGPEFKNQQLYDQIRRDVPQQEIIDVTLACIGECNQQYTGPRDGKTLHSYVSSSLLKHFGVPCPGGFYKEYERKISDETPDKVKFAYLQNESDLGGWSRFMIKLKTGFDPNLPGGEIVFERSRHGKSIRLRGKNYRAMLKFAPYLGKESKKYLSLVDQLKDPGDIKKIKPILAQINSLDVKNQYLKRELESACGSLLRSAQEFRSW